MLTNYFKTAWRNLLKNKKSSLINISGLALGMAVFILITLWVWDEMSFNKYHTHFEKIGHAVQNQTYNGETFSIEAVPFPLGNELRANYAHYFKHVVMASWEGDRILSYQDKHLSKGGIFMDSGGPEMLSLHITDGSMDGLKDMNSIMLSQTTAKALFGDKSPINELMKINQTLNVKVTAVYEDLPYNTSFRNLKFIAPWDLYVISEPWIRRARSDWNDNSFQLFAQINENMNFATVNQAIGDSKLMHQAEDDKKFQAKILLHPMKDWHLRNDWKDGQVTGGRISYVRLFIMIGVFVLLLACINFMNLSTARSERRAKEVGIRKTVGSSKAHLIIQFLTESVLTVFLALCLSLLLIQLALPWFNEVADKRITLPWTNGWFWAFILLFNLLTGIVAGSYPAFFLSAFKPLSVLKGTFRHGRFAGLPRKVLVVTQFTVSVILITGTLIVYRQIQHTRDRHVGYDRDRLMMIEMKTSDFYGKYDILRTRLKQSGVVTELSESSSPLTAIWSSGGDFRWEGKDPNLTTDFATIRVTHEFGNSIQWKMKTGRDFSREFVTDSSALIINEAAVRFMGLEDPLHKTITWNNKNFHIIGIVEDIIMNSPFDPAKATVYQMDYDNVNWINLKLNPAMNIQECISGVEAVFSEVIPNAPFEYKFADTEYDAKFAQEKQIGQLATFFTLFAVIISCLGVFGLASFIAEQRTKEIGIRKIVGASIFQLWTLLSRDFIFLVLISCLIAIPVSYYFLSDWLQQYQFRTNIPWWIFAATTTAALLITLITVSFQTLKAAVSTPVKSLRNE